MFLTQCLVQFQNFANLLSKAHSKNPFHAHIATRAVLEILEIEKDDTDILAEMAEKISTKGMKKFKVDEKSLKLSKLTLFLNKMIHMDLAIIEIIQKCSCDLTDLLWGQVGNSSVLWSGLW